MTDELCPVMSRPLQYSQSDNWGNYPPLGEFFEVYCGENCKARRKDGGCKLIDGKE